MVILDVASGKYLGLPVANAQALSAWVVGWPVAGGAQAPAPVDPPPLLNELLTKRLLTFDASAGKAAAPVKAFLRDIWLGDSRQTNRVRIRWHHVWSFLLAVTRAGLSLRLLSLERIVRRARDRKSRQSRNAIVADELTDLMMVYGVLRPWIYGTKDACMLHSIAVLEFLARYGIFPDWVIGVRTAPFRAHSWLQVSDQVLTDSPLHVSRMTPILIV